MNGNYSTNGELVDMAVSITRDELNMLRLMAKGAEQEQIARAMKITTAAVRYRRRVLLAKLDALNTTHAVAMAYERGWLTDVLPKAA